jgi:hypothetical protein
MVFPKVLKILGITTLKVHAREVVIQPFVFETEFGRKFESRDYAISDRSHEAEEEEKIIEDPSILRLNIHNSFRKKCLFIHTEICQILNRYF